MEVEHEGGRVMLRGADGAASECPSIEDTFMLQPLQDGKDGEESIASTRAYTANGGPAQLAQAVPGQAPQQPPSNPRTILRNFTFRSKS